MKTLDKHLTKETQDELSEYLKKTRERLIEKYGNKGENVLYGAICFSVLEMLPDYCFARSEQEVIMLNALREQLSRLITLVAHNALQRDETSIKETATEMWAEMELYTRERNAILNKAEPNYSSSSPTEIH